MRKDVKEKVSGTNEMTKLAEVKQGTQLEVRYVEEALYFNEKEERFYLYGYSGPAGRYAQPTGIDEWMPGEALNLIRRELVLEWLQKHGIRITDEIQRALEQTRF